MRNLFVALLLVVLTGTVLGQTTVPFTFSSGAAAKASEVNANFQALATAINNLAAKVDKLEGTFTAADVAGTYAFASLEVEFGGGGGLAQLARHLNVNGTVTLNANGTFVLSVIQAISQLNLIFSKEVNSGTNALTANTNLTSNATPVSVPAGSSGTWSLTGKTLVLSGSQFTATFTSATGPGLFLSARFIPESATHNALVFLVRQ